MGVQVGLSRGEGVEGRTLGRVGSNLDGEKEKGELKINRGILLQMPSKKNSCRKLAKQ